MIDKKLTITLVFSIIALMLALVLAFVPLMHCDEIKPEQKLEIPQEINPLKCIDVKYDPCVKRLLLGA